MKSAVQIKNSYSYLVQSEDEKEIQQNTTANKNKKRRQRKKKNADAMNSLNTSNNGVNDGPTKTEMSSEEILSMKLKRIAEQCISNGFCRQDVDAMMENMWKDGIEINNENQVIELLSKQAQLKENSEKKHSSPTLNSSTTDHSSNGIKNELKDSKISSTPATTSTTTPGTTTSTTTTPGTTNSTSPPPVATSKLEQNDSDTNVERESNVTLSLQERLEIAASHEDLNASLAGLVAWSEMYRGTKDMDVFFSSKALSMFLVNILTSGTRISPSVLNSQLIAILSNCLACGNERYDKNKPPEVVKRLSEDIRNVLDAFVVLKKNGESPIEQVAERIAESIRNCKLRSASSPISLAREFQDMDFQIAQTHNKQGKSTGNDIREMFKRRDLHSAAVMLTNKKYNSIINLFAIHGIQQSKQNGNTSPEESTVQEDLQFLQKITPEDQIDNIHSAREEAKQVQNKMDAIKKENQLKEQSLEESLKEVSSEIESLENQKQDILAQLALVEKNIAAKQEEQLGIRKEIESHCAGLESEIASCVEEHKGALSSLQNLEHRENIVLLLRNLDMYLQDYTKQFTEDLASLLKENLPSSLQQFFYSCLSYITNEVKCINFMKKRVENSTVKLQSLDREINEYLSLGMTTVVDELHGTVATLKNMIDEDQSCWKALHSRAEDVFLNFQKVVESHLDLVVPFAATVYETKAIFETVSIGNSWRLPERLQAPRIVNKEKSIKTTTTPCRADDFIEIERCGIEEIKEEKINHLKHVHVPPKLNWASATTPQISSRSISDIQAEELENRMSKVNPSRLDKGKEPVRSSAIGQSRNIHA